MTTDTLGVLLELLASRPGDEPGDLEAGLVRIAQAGIDLFDADLCAVFPFNPVTQRFMKGRRHIWRGRPLPGTEIQLTRPRPKGLTRSLLDEDQVIVIEKLKDSKGMSSPLARAQGIVSLAGIPLKIRASGKPLSVVYINFRRQIKWHEERKSLLKLFQRQAELMLQPIWFLRRYRSISRTRRIPEQNLDTPTALVTSVKEQLSDVFEARHCFLLGIKIHGNGPLRFYGTIEREQIEGREVPVKGRLRSVLERGKSDLYVRSDSRGSGSPIGLGLEDPGSALIAPLRLDGETLGVLTVQHPEVEVYDKEDQNLFQLLANQVTLMVRNQQLLADLEKLRNVGELLTQQLSSEDVLEQVVEQILEATQADLVILYSYSQRHRRFRTPPTDAGKYLEPNAPQPKEVRRGDIASLLVDHDAPVFAEDSRELYKQLGGQSGGRVGDFEEREQVVSTAALPLKVGNECVGALFVNFRQLRRFDTRKRQLIAGLARYAAIAIRNARAFGERANRPLQELEVLRRTDRLLIEAAELRGILDTLLEHATQVVDAAQASVLLFDKKTQLLKTEAAIGTHQGRSLGQEFSLEDSQGIAVRAFNEKRSILIGNVRDPRWREYYVSVGGRTISELDVPMLIGEEAVGVLNFEAPKKNAFDEKDQKFLEVLAGQAALAVERARDHEQLSRLAKEHQLLIALGEKLVQPRKMLEVYELIVRQAIETTQASAGVLALANHEEGGLKVVAEQGTDVCRVDWVLPFEQGIIGQAATQKQIVNEPDVRKVEEYFEAVSDTRSKLAVPILERNSIRGVLNLESPQEGFFGPQDEILMKALTDLALLALQATDRLNEARRWSARLTDLHELSREVVKQLATPEELMEEVVKRAVTLTNSDFADMDLYDRGKPCWSYLAIRRDDGQIIAERRRYDDPEAEHPDRGLMLRVAETREPVLIASNAKGNPLYRGLVDIEGEMIVPLVKEGDLLGVLNVETRVPRLFDEQALKLLELFAAQVVIAIGLSGNYAAAKREKNRFQNLYKAGRQLAEVPSRAQVTDSYAVVLRKAQAYWDCRQIVVRRFDSEANELVVRAVKDRTTPPFPRLSVDEGLNGHVFKTRRSVLVEDADQLPTIDLPEARRSEPEDRSFAIAPILFGDKYYGNLALSDHEPLRFAGLDRDLLEGLAGQLGLTLHRLEELERRQKVEREREHLEEVFLLEKGREALEIAHRFKNDLGWIPTRVARLKKRLSQSKLEPQELDKLFSELEKDVGSVLRSGAKILRENSSGQRRESIEVPVRQLLEDVLAELKIPESIEVVMDPGERGGAIVVDVSYKGVTSALFNLMDNAIRAMPEGGMLTLSIESAEAHVDLLVTDTGTGIPPELQSKIFELGTSIRKGGLGLPSARRSLQIEGGDVVLVRSSPGRGSRFRARIPLSVQ